MSLQTMLWRQRVNRQARNLREREMKTTLRLYLVRETALARLFENAAGSQQWIPRSVCTSCTKFAKEENKPQVCEVTIENWWLQKNPWPEPENRLI